MTQSTMKFQDIAIGGQFREAIPGSPLWTKATESLAEASGPDYLAPSPDCRVDPYVSAERIVPIVHAMAMLLGGER